MNTYNDKDRKGHELLHCVQKNSVNLLWKTWGGEGMHWSKQTRLPMQMQCGPESDNLLSNFLSSLPHVFFFFTGDFSDNPACWYYQQHTSVSKTLTRVINVFHQHPCLAASCFVMKSAKPQMQKTVPPPFTPYNVWCNFHLMISGFIQSISIGQGLHYSQGHPAKPDLIESTLLKEKWLSEE